MNTLEHQLVRLQKELAEAREQIALIEQQTCQDARILNYYQDLIARNTQLVMMINDHIDVSQDSSRSFVASSLR